MGKRNARDQQSNARVLLSRRDFTNYKRKELILFSFRHHC